jgi:hypothetical protein
MASCALGQLNGAMLRASVKIPIGVKISDANVFFFRLTHGPDKVAVRTEAGSAMMAPTPASGNEVPLP